MIKPEEITGYLTFGLRFIHNDEPETYMMFSFTLPHDQNPLPISGFNNAGKAIAVFMEGCTPILRTELTDEEYRLIGGKIAGKRNEIFLELGKRYMRNDTTATKKAAEQVSIYLYFLKFDIHGLVERGDAIAAESLKINPYKR